MATVLLATTTVTALGATVRFGCDMETSNRWGIARSPDYGTKKATTFDYYGGVNEGFGCAILQDSEGKKLGSECADSSNRSVEVTRQYDATHYHAHSGSMLP